MIIYDIEVEKGILGKNDVPVEGISYCKGWHDHANMGISCIGVYSYITQRYHVFLKDNFGEFLSMLANSPVCVGFNSIGFDNKVILENVSEEGSVRENLKKYFEIASFDILAEIWKAKGLDPTRFYWGTHGGYGLDEMCRVNFGTMKSGNGALAPVHWQQGKHGAVIDYCLNDIKLTKQLLDKIIFEGNLKCPKTGVEILMRKPSV